MKKSFTRLKISATQRNILSIIALFCLGCITNIYGQQATIFSNGFESGGVAWTTEGIPLENSWVIGECAGNGTSAAGVTAAYISTGNIIGCGEEYAYTNADVGTQSIVLFREVDAYCGTNLTLSFDYQITGDANDFGEVVYSTTGGASWILVPGGTLGATAGWDTQTIGLPALLENTTFHLGFRFTYDDVTIANPPLSIDNVILQVTDIESPLMVCPSIDTMYMNELSCSSDIGDLSKRIITLSDNCTDSLLITFDQTPALHMLTGNQDNINVELIAYDEAGNSTTCIINVVLLDTIAPVVLCPADMDVFVDNNCEYEIVDFTGLISPTDNCTASIDLIISQDPLPGVIVSGHNTLQDITFSIEDEAGNIGECAFTLTLLDNIDPTITCPGTQQESADSNCESVFQNYRSLAVLGDNCTALNDLVVIQTPTPGLPMLNDQNITLEVSDGNGNSASCQFLLELIDDTDPSIICPADDNLVADLNCEAVIGDYTASAIVDDNCTSIGNLLIEQTPVMGSTVSGQTNVIQITVTDEAGNSNSCQFNVSVDDETNPDITCPVDQIVSTNINCQINLADYSTMVTVDDNCSDIANLTITQVPVAGTTLSGAGTVQLVTMEVEDEGGNLASCAFNVTLLDDLDPEIVCGGTLNASVDSNCDYILTDYTNHGVATDNCTAQGDIIKTQSPIVGTILGIGNHVIEITAEDESSNTSSCTFTLSVVDNIDPNIISCAPNTTISADAGDCSGTLGDYTALVDVDDNCTALIDLSIAQSPVSGTVISSNETVTITVTDISGNSSICTFNVGVQDTSDPVVDCPNSVTVTTSGLCDYAIPDFSSVTTGTDNCTATGDLVYSQLPTAGSMSSGVTNVTVSLTDEQGNTGNCIVQIIPEDFTPPSLTCPSDEVVNIGSGCNTILSDYTGSAIASDNCSSVTLSQLPEAGEVLITGNHTILIEAEDASGNTSSCAFNLFIQESEAPQISCPAPISTCDPVVTFAVPVGTDNCIAITTQTDASGLTSGDTFPIGVTTLSYEVVDSSANIASCSFTIEILEYPDIANVGDDIQLCDTISTIISANMPSSGVGEWSVIQGSGTLNNQFSSITGINNLSLGDNLVVWTISSSLCGNSTDTLTISVYDLPLPASTIDTLFACDVTFIELTGNQPSAGTGLWYDVSGAATFSNPNGVPTTVNDLQEGWNQLVWSISNGSCPVSRDTAFVYITEQARIIQPDVDSLTICLGTDPIQLIGVQPQEGTSVRWSVIQGDAFLYTPLEHESLLTNFSFGSTTVVYEMRRPECPATTDTLYITANICGEFGEFPNMITPNGDGQNDVWVLEFLDSAYPESVVRVFNRWGNMVFESTGYKENWDGTHNGNRLPMGTYYYTIELNDTENTVLKGNISIIY